MKIIDLAICVNNVDPKGIGRIRCVRYNDFVSSKEKGITYESWDDRDSFIASPFLPANINFLPEKGQAVKIINYTTEKETVNQEYIAGPFSTMYDFNGQSYLQQIENTTYGVAVEHRPDIREQTGEYIDLKTENAFAKEKDYAIYGKFGSDVIFTENGLQLRGGKLLSKEGLNANKREKMVTFPLMSEKTSSLYLKKFPKKANLITKRSIIKKSDNIDLKAIVEYEVDSITSPTTISFFVYKVINTSGPNFKTGFFNSTTPLTTSAVKLLNIDNTTTTPTFTVSVSDIDGISKIIKDKLLIIHEDGLNKINGLLTSEDLHPFFFRPSEKFKQLSGDISQITKKIKLTIIGPGPESGLVWSKGRLRPQQITTPQVEKNLIIDENSNEQTFAAVKSDKIYLLSTDTNEGNPPCVECGNSINFNNLDKYELSQKDYIENIDPNTYASVRGENLTRVLRQIVQVLFTHSHNINKSIESQPDYAAGQILLEMIKTLETDLLNKSIRLN